MPKKEQKIAFKPHPNGTFSVGLGFINHRFNLKNKRFKWTLVELDQLADFEFEPAPGVRIRPRIIVRIEGRPYNKKARENWRLHRIRSRAPALC